jgi:hypothetical protein
MQITKSEREELYRNLKERQKLLKAGTKMRNTELKADFENHMGQEYRFDQDEVWKQAVQAVKPQVHKAQEAMAARCRELGIPKEFAPTITLNWSGRGYGNALERDKAEKRRMAYTAIDAMQQRADLKIDQAILEAHTNIAASALTSETALARFASLPSVEALMPPPNFAEIAGESDTPVPERLISPNALRQRRFRERQALLKHNAEGVTPALCNGGDPSEEASDNAPERADNARGEQ